MAGPHLIQVGDHILQLFDKDGTLVREIEQVRRGDEITTRLARGNVTSRVEGTEAL